MFNKIRTLIQIYTYDTYLIAKSPLYSHSMVAGGFELMS